MITRKICIIGDFAVGKTSLVARFVHNQFSDKYLTTIGVKVDTKEVSAPGVHACKLAVWDVAGTDTATSLFLRYLRGASGFLLVADGTRSETLDCALKLRQSVASQFPGLPFVGLVNKSDLKHEQKVGDATLEQLNSTGNTWLRTSALTGGRVQEAFLLLVQAMDKVE